MRNATKKCVFCRAVFTRGSTRASQWSRAKYCSRSCCNNARFSTSIAAAIATRACATCGGILSRRDDESLGGFLRRGTCSLQCRQALVARTRRASRALPIGRLCISCRSVLVIKHGESLANFRARRFCNRECSSYAHRKSQPPTDSRHCAACDSVFERRLTESFTQFARRTFCGRQCVDRSKRRKLDIFGIKLTVHEFCRMTGESFNGVRARIKNGKPPWRITGHIGDGRGGGRWLAPPRIKPVRARR